jgi:hypothetical protein
MPLGSLSDSWNPVRRGITLLYVLAVALLLAGCLPQPAQKPAILKAPSKVITQDGMEYFVYGLKLPGTFQELKLKEKDTLTWVPLSILRYVRFTGPEVDGYRRAEIVLTSGERLQGDLYVEPIIEGTTDIGYWNMSLRGVKTLGMGMD